MGILTNDRFAFFNNVVSAGALFRHVCVCLFTGDRLVARERKLTSAFGNLHHTIISNWRAAKTESKKHYANTQLAKI